MALTLYYHPLSAFCWKALVALYENETVFTPLVINHGNEQSLSQLIKVWPMGEFPVLQDSQNDQIVPQSSSIIEYLNLHYAGSTPLIPDDKNAAFEVRRWADFFDSYVNVHMQKIVGNVLRPADQKDPLGVKEARDMIQSAYEILENKLSGSTWFLGETFTLADCSACPALFYGNKVEPIAKNYPKLGKYLEGLMQRPSFARVLEEAKPYFQYFPYKSEE